MTHSLNIVAVCDPPGGEKEPAAVLSGIIGVTPYEAGSRLNVAGRFPVVVAVYAEHASAEETAGRLRSAGFGTVVLSQDEIESESRRFIVRKFSFDDRQLRVESRQGEGLVVDYSQVEVMLRGTCIEQVTKSWVEKEKKLSLGRAVISGGLMLSKTIEKHHVDTSENREGFLHLYAGRRYILVFRETSLVYSSLGPMLRPTRSANFALVTAELKRRCHGAFYDDSLLNRSVQTRILGPLFNPEEHLDIAITLMAKFLRRSK